MSKACWTSNTHICTCCMTFQEHSNRNPCKFHNGASNAGPLSCNRLHPCGLASVASVNYQTWNRARAPLLRQFLRHQHFRGGDQTIVDLAMQEPSQSPLGTSSGF